MSGRKAKASDDGGIPRWFVTYSDVITLLMTFFILLLTFASSEPEGFEMMQQSLFGSGGSSGTIGNKLEAQEKDSYVVRVKPASSRLTPHGSSMPPMYSDPVTEAASKGLAALKENNDLAHFERFSLNVSVQLYIDSEGTITEIAKRHLQMLAKQMKVLPLEMTLSVASTEYLNPVAKIAEFLSANFEIPAGRIGIEVQSNVAGSSNQMQIKMRQQIQK